MHPRINELLEHLDRQREILRDAVASVPVDKQTIEPAPGRWSVLGVLEHLAIVEPRITRLLQQRIGEARAANLGQDTDHSPILPTLDLTRVLDRSRTISASEQIHPRGGKDVDALWQSLDQSRAALRSVIIDADGLALGEISHPHPAFGYMTMYSWIGFIGSHEARHAAQIREIGATLGGPT